MAIFTANSSPAGAAINNSIKDPMQGFDADVWVIDQATGNQLLVGRFTSIQLTIRNATEPYMEFNQRIPRMLDGEFQFGWVLERGLIDTRLLESTFGFDDIRREMRIGRSPRMVITFDLSAPELDERSLNNVDLRNNNLGELLVNGNDNSRRRRHSVGQYRLVYCKVDSMTIGAMAGRSVIAVRWEGLAEGISYVDSSSVWAGTVVGNPFTPADSQNTNSVFYNQATIVNDARPTWALQNGNTFAL
jgi:hypothetical protein